MTYNNARTPREARRIYYLKSKGRPLDYQKPRMRIHGHASRALTPDEYAELITLQCGRCWICRSSSRLYVDHCHTTGIVRGLICPTCNLHTEGRYKQITPDIKAYLEDPPAMRLFTIKIPLDMQGRSERIR